jgi:hypothetical protein
MKRRVGDADNIAVVDEVFLIAEFHLLRKSSRTKNDRVMLVLATEEKAHHLEETTLPLLQGRYCAILIESSKLESFASTRVISNDSGCHANFCSA